MKLLYVVPRLGGAGGMQRVLLLKAGYLADKLGYDITVLVTNPDLQEILFEVSPRLKIVYLQPQRGNVFSYFLSYCKGVKKTVSGIQPDVVVMCDNGLKSFFLPWLLPKKIPLVYEMHASRFLIEKEIRQNKLLRMIPPRALLNFVFSRYRQVVTLTQGGRAEWQFKNSTVISNSLWFSPAGQNPLTSKKIIAMGRHSQEKGYERMFNIWKKVSEYFPDWTLEIYGAYNPDYNLILLADENKLENIIFSEPVKDIEATYSHASISIMTSVSETFGLALLEAMACGVPCVAYNCPTGPAELICNGVNGFLVEDDDERGFISALQQLMYSQELRLQFGKAAKQKAAMYNLEAIMQQWNNLFTSLANGA
ncbi:glycosyltransferase [Flavobacterium sp. RHBU_24]|uniref:glycosyltransferase n=1 Tax=Flavobacterium sp. RHBU_24 TaxID=3391185 RepID=UPI0039855496